jgi:ABC-2 type transport system permease protein
MARKLPDPPMRGRTPARAVERLPVGVLGTIRLYLAQRVKVKLAYRADFLVNSIGDVLLAGVGPLFLSTLFSHVKHLGDWTGPEVLFIWGFAECIVGLFFMFFQGLYALNQRYILGGELDRALLRPVDPYFQVLLDNISLEDVPIFLLGNVVMLVAVWWGLPAIPWWKWALMPIFWASGAAVMGGFLTAIASIGFHLHHRGTAVGLVFQLATFNRYPIDLFARPLQWILTYALPLAFAGFYPATFFLDRPAWHPYAVAQPFVGLFCLALGYVAWRIGLGRYTSSGS